MKTIFRLFLPFLALVPLVQCAPQPPQEVLCLDHGANNPRNSEGDFVLLGDGRILFVYTHFYGGDGNKEDHGSSYLASRCSHDHGRHWSSEDKVEVENEGRQNVHSVSLLRLDDGTIALFYLKRDSYSSLMPMMRISQDEAETWSDAVPCLADTVAYCVMNNARAIQTTAGRILVPLALHPNRVGEDGSVRFEPNAELLTLWSDDRGRSWHRGTPVPKPEDVITQEPGLVEMQDGSVMMYCRTYSGCQYKALSRDGGISWSQLESTDIKSPAAPATIVPMPRRGDWLMAWNNNPQGGKWDGQRSPQTLAISHNEGESWENLFNLEDDPHGWYCYSAIRFIDRNRFLMSYCSVVKTPGSGLNGLEDTRLVLIDRRWLEKR
ncbi:MAG: exo-alpha-sialidase [Bacteroidales bacterium]|nr:exo-alpha-sialidase [Bacteroidales bacterium]